MSLITEELENMARGKDPDQIKSKRKALIALFPYAVWRERGGKRKMFDAYFDIFAVPEARKLVGKPLVGLLGEASPNSPNWAITLILPYNRWGDELRGDQNPVTGWASAALAVSYTEELGRSVVDSLLRIASKDHLLPFIPVDIWAWLKKRPSLPPICWGRDRGTRNHVVRRVRELGDVELLESYFLLVWSEWDYIYDGGLREMIFSIREDFDGIRVWRRREVLIKRLDHVLGELGKGLKHLRQQKLSLDRFDVQKSEEQCRRLKDELLEVDRAAFTRTPFRLITLFDLLTPARMPQNLTLHSFVLSLSHIRSRVFAALAPPSPNSVFHSHIGSPLSPFYSSTDRRPTLEYIRLPPPPDTKNATLMTSVESGSAGGHVTRVIVPVSVLFDASVLAYASLFASSFTAFLTTICEVKRTSWWTPGQVDPADPSGLICQYFEGRSKDSI